jgi:glycerol-3-phosphate dehydrogenase
LIRDLRALSSRTWDLLVVGGGIAGAWIALDASLRGLSVALVEAVDFGSGASANSLKILHGGLRYLRRAQFSRLRRSALETAILQQVAPHMVRPLPVLVPTAGIGGRSRAALRAAFLAHRFLSRGALDRHGLPGLPAGKVLRASEFDEHEAALAGAGTTGGAVWYDGQIRNSERLVLSLLRTAAKQGAVLANHVEATSLLGDGGVVRGAVVTDRLSGEELSIPSRIVANAAGASALRLAATLPGIARPEKPPFRALAWNLVLDRRPGPVAVGFQSRLETPSAEVLGDSRYLFLVPWENHTLFGTGYRLVPPGEEDRGGEGHRVRTADLETLIAEARASAPALDLAWSEVSQAHRGLLPIKDGLESGRSSFPAEEDHLIDHASHGSPGALTLILAKYTTARAAAERAVDVIIERLGCESRDCATATTPIWGGEQPIPDTEEASGLVRSRFGEGPSPATTRRLLAAYGSRLPEVLQCGDSVTPGSSSTVAPGSGLLAAEVVHAVRNEMGCSLADVLFRRVGLGAAGCPPPRVLADMASVMAAELGWGDLRLRDEVKMCLGCFEGLPRPTLDEVLSAETPPLR